MELLRNWLWRRRYRKWRASVGMNLSPKKLIFATSGVTDSLKGIGVLSQEEIESRQRLQQMLGAQMQHSQHYRQQCGGLGALFGSGLGLGVLWGSNSGRFGARPPGRY